MRLFAFVIVAFALFTASFVSVAQAHVNEQGSSQQMELRANLGDVGDVSTLSSLCDMHCHNHVLPAKTLHSALPKDIDELFVSLYQSPFSSPQYGLKRPPRI